MAAGQRLGRFAHGRQHPGAEPVSRAQVRRQRDGLVEVLEIQRVVAVQIRLRPKDERIGADRLEHDLGHLHRGFAGLVGLFVGEQDASFGKCLAEDVAEFVGNEHGADIVELKLLGDGFGGKGLLQPDHDRGDLVSGKHDFDLVERFDGVTPDHHALVLADLARRPPCLVQLGDRGRARRDAAETGGLDRRRRG